MACASRETRPDPSRFGRVIALPKKAREQPPAPSPRRSTMTRRGLSPPTTAQSHAPWRPSGALPRTARRSWPRRLATANIWSKSFRSLQRTAGQTTIPGCRRWQPDFRCPTRGQLSVGTRALARALASRSETERNDPDREQRNAAAVRRPRAGRRARTPLACSHTAERAARRNCPYLSSGYLSTYR